MMWIVYKFTSNTSKKSYIGMTNGDINSRFTRHVYDSNNKSTYHFHKAIIKYNPDDFNGTILGVFSNKEVAFKGEIYFIKKHNTFKHGYNMTIGGDSGPSCIGEKNGMYGKTHSAETRFKISLKKKLLVGKNHPRYGIISPLKGKTYDQIHGKVKATYLKETLRKAITGIKRPYNKGRNNPSRTLQARFKISEARKNNEPDIFINGIQYRCIKDAMETLKLSRYKIKKLIRGKNENNYR